MIVSFFSLNFNFYMFIQFLTLYFSVIIYNPFNLAPTINKETT